VILQEKSQNPMELKPDRFHPDNSHQSQLYSTYIAHDHALAPLLGVIDSEDSDSQRPDGVLVRSL
jgi:hypothetical protein